MMKKKVKWYRGEGGPYANYMNTEKAKPYTEIYMNLLSIFSKYYTNKNITKKELIKELSFIDYNNSFILEIKRIKGEAEYKKYGKMLFDFEVRKVALFIEKKEGWSRKIAMELGYIEKIGKYNIFGNGNLKKAEQKLKELMDRGIYSIGAIVMYFSNIRYQDKKVKKVIEWYEKYKDKISDDALMRRKYVTDGLVKAVLRYYKANGKESRGKELQQQFKDRIAKLKEKGMKYKYIE